MNNSKQSYKTTEFIDRKFEEVIGGYYESEFYYTPNGSMIN